MLLFWDTAKSPVLLPELSLPRPRHKRHDLTAPSINKSAEIKQPHTKLPLIKIALLEC